MTHYQPHSMLVTGGAGFIGANFVRHVLAHDPLVHIVNLDKLTYAGSLDNIQSLPDETRHHFIQGDITDAVLVNDIMARYHIDTIVHFAAESHVDRSIESPQDFVNTNIVGTFVLLEAAKRHWLDKEKRGLDRGCRFHHVSTDEVYGSLQADEPPFTEERACQPRSPYSASKAGSDHLVRAYGHTYQLPLTLSHCSNNYGPCQHHEKFIPTIIRTALQGKPIPIYGNGKNIRDWLYVDDHCRAIMAIIKQGKLGESYNIGGNNEWENIALARYICDALDKRVPRDHAYAALLSEVTDRLGHDFRYAIDNAKINNELGWKPQETLASGMAKTLDFYLEKY